MFPQIWRRLERFLTILTRRLIDVVYEPDMLPERVVMGGMRGGWYTEYRIYEHRSWVYFSHYFDLGVLSAQAWALKFFDKSFFKTKQSS